MSGGAGPAMMLELEQVQAYYGKSHVLQGISLHVDAGELVTLLGRNGAGKTTTLKCIAGIDVQRDALQHMALAVVGLHLLELEHHHRRVSARPLMPARRR